MRNPLFTFLAVFMLAPFVAYAQVTQQDSGLQNQPQGYYVTDGGWGVLMLHSGTKERKAGTKLFSISTTGANGHSCSLSGSVLSTGKLELDGDKNPEEWRHSNCILHFKPDEQGIKIIEDKNSTACHDFCGMRAGFLGYYNHVEHICEPSNVRIAIGEYEFSHASDEMNIIHEKVMPILQTCANTMRDEDAAALREVVALANYHAGDKAACQKTLLPYQKIISEKDEDIDSAYSGTSADADTWHRIAKRLRDIADLCKN